jgi:hypothetical protein
MSEGRFLQEFTPCTTPPTPGGGNVTPREINPNLAAVPALSHRYRQRGKYLAKVMNAHFGCLLTTAALATGSVSSTATATLSNRTVSFSERNNSSWGRSGESLLPPSSAWKEQILVHGNGNDDPNHHQGSLKINPKIYNPALLGGLNNVPTPTLISPAPGDGHERIFPAEPHAQGPAKSKAAEPAVEMGRPGQVRWCS